MTTLEAKPEIKQTPTLRPPQKAADWFDDLQLELQDLTRAYRDGEEDRLPTILSIREQQAVLQQYIKGSYRDYQAVRDELDDMPQKIKELQEALEHPSEGLQRMMRQPEFRGFSDSGTPDENDPQQQLLKLEAKRAVFGWLCGQ